MKTKKTSFLARAAMMLLVMLLTTSTAWATIGGTGTPSDPYTINSADDWNTFASNVSGGNSYQDMYVKLTADINVTQKVGVVSGNAQEKPFSGTFDGNGHTITATITDTENQGTALFCYINGATIKNLSVAGTINGGQYHAAAIVGFSKGTGNSIRNCIATAHRRTSGTWPRQQHQHRELPVQRSAHQRQFCFGCPLRLG